MHASRPQGGNRLNVDKRRNIAVNTLRNKVLKPLFEPRLDLPHSFFAHVKLAAEIGERRWIVGHEPARPQGEFAWVGHRLRKFHHNVVDFGIKIFVLDDLFWRLRIVFDELANRHSFVSGRRLVDAHRGLVELPRNVDDILLRDAEFFGDERRRRVGIAVLNEL